MLNCENCTLEHDGSYGSGRFCNSKCARAFSTKANRVDINRRVSESLSGRPSSNPFQPGHVFYGHLIDVGPKISAAARKRFDAWISEWLAGAIVIGRGPCSRIKRYLVEKFKGCQRCGWSEVHPITGIIPVQLHHIDGNHDNNSPENLELLCPNCHSLTPNYMALNKGTPCPGKRYN